MAVWAVLANQALSKAIKPSWWLAGAAPILSVGLAFMAYLVIAHFYWDWLALLVAMLVMLIGGIVLGAYSKNEKKLFLSWLSF